MPRALTELDDNQRQPLTGDLEALNHLSGRLTDGFGLDDQKGEPPESEPLRDTAGQRFAG